MITSTDIVLAHDYLIQMGGAERVVASMVRKWTGSPIYTSAVKWDTLLPEFRAASIHSSWMQRIPGIQRHFKKLFAFYPGAFRSFGVIDAPAAWVSASTFAKCIRFTPRTATVLYCHNPTRFLWQASEYVDSEVRSGPLNRLVHTLLPPLRAIDRAAARRFDVIVANSENVRRRIATCYGREAQVVHPPVEVDRFKTGGGDGGFYLVVSRLVAYKCIHRAVEACTALGRRLVIVGKGPDETRLRRMAGPTVEFRGHLSDEEVTGLMERCTALIFPGQEDFGIAPVEAQACGKPVIAFKGGGALETITEGTTGRFFDEVNTTMADAILASEATLWEPAHIRAHAERFSERRFHDRMDSVLRGAMAAKQASIEKVALSPQRAF
ncbi:MAG TPA: glycosyltransferase [Chthoniobacteraceae bacterium]|jgi:glycosyltransferase involved in cell wall biosynthesis|nr:glycosyltransferase [Chthoniobacteraceae bacterium]